MLTYEIDKESGCWLWTGPTCSGGRYGRITGAKKFVMAHRYSFAVHKGEIPAGRLVCHTCDNGLCVNPDHLFLGSVSDNSKDAFSKGRLPLFAGTERIQQGENNARAKYSAGLITEIRAYYDETQCSYKHLAERFGLKSKRYAEAIIARRVWNY